MPLTRLGHVNIRTPLVEETVRFFEVGLGLKRGQAATTIDQVNNVWLYDERGAPVIHVNAPAPGEAERPADVVSRLDHMAFDCTDPAAFAARLKAARIPFVTVHTEAGGYVQYNCRDPNGLKVELTFAPEG